MAAQGVLEQVLGRAESPSVARVKWHYSSAFNGGGTNCLDLFQSTSPVFQWQTSLYARQWAHPSMGA